MNSNRQTSRALHEEHRTNLELLGRVEQALARVPRQNAGADPDLRRLVAALGQQITHDVERHFVFEEQELFSRMADAGDGDVAGLLVEEHDAIREVAAELMPLVTAAVEGSLDDEGWQALSRGALELTERQIAHIQKEEMMLLPLLDDLLDDDVDGQLAMDYITA